MNALGFDWSVRPREQAAAQKSFEQRIADLKAYKEKHGRVNVKMREDKSLYGFCYNVRYARINPAKSNMVLNYDHIASLDALGQQESALKESHLNSG